MIHSYPSFLSEMDTISIEQPSLAGSPCINCDNPLTSPEERPFEKQRRRVESICVSTFVFLLLGVTMLIFGGCIYYSEYGGDEGGRNAPINYSPTSMQHHNFIPYSNEARYIICVIGFSLGATLLAMAVVLSVKYALNKQIQVSKEVYSISPPPSASSNVSDFQCRVESEDDISNPTNANPIKQKIKVMSLDTDSTLPPRYYEAYQYPTYSARGEDINYATESESLHDDGREHQVMNQSPRHSPPNYSVLIP